MKKFLSAIISIFLGLTSVSMSAAPAQAAGCPSPMSLTYDLSLLTGSLEVVLPLSTMANPVEVNWGDGNIETAYSGGTFSHTYASASTYTIQLCGDLNTFGRNSIAPVAGITALTSVNSFGNLPITSLLYAFVGASNLTSVPATLPSTVTVLYGTFYGATSFNDADVTTWNTSNVQTMGQTFLGASSFNQNISSWNTANSTQFNGMFENATSFNQPIGTWNTASSTVFYRMFAGATSFNQNIGAWNVSGSYNFEGMFEGATVFNNGGSADINNWNTVTSTNMARMFYDAINFNQNIGGWNTANVTDMSTMFNGASAFNNGGSSDINNWDVGKVTNFLYTFRLSAFNQPIGDWNIGEHVSTPVISFYGMFEAASAFNQPIGDWDVSNVKNFASMFSRASGGFPAMTFNQNIGSWNVSNGLTFSYMFWRDPFNNGGSDSIKNWGPFKENSVLDYMFVFSDFNQPIGDWDISNVKSAKGMFSYTTAFDQNLSSWDISSIVTTSGYSPGAEGNWSGHLENAFDGTGLSTPNYDALLIGLASRIDSPGFTSGIKLGASSTKYSCNAAAARAALVTAGMIITDAGQASVPAPELLSVTAGDGSVSLSWTLPSCEGVPVTPIKYQISFDNGSTWYDTNTTETSNSIAPMTNGQLYSMRVRVVTAAGTSPASNMLTVTPMGGETVELFVIPRDTTIQAGTSAPDASFYLFDIREGSPSGSAVNPTLTSQPVCTSSYNSSMTSANSPLTITCSGGTGDGYTFDTSSTATLVITDAEPEPEPEPEPSGPMYTIRYSVNSATNGDLPIPAAIVAEGNRYTVLANFGGLTKTGYEFVGWSDGFRTYLPGDSFVVSTNLTLFAVWKAITAETVGTFTPNKLDQTAISWNAVTGATGYQITVNGRPVYSGTATSFTYAKLVGPASKVKVKVTTSTGTTTQLLKYQAGKKIYAAVVRFAENSSTITGKYAERLSALATLIKWQGFQNLLVIGYTDSQGGNSNASRLSKARAKAVAAYLSAKGVKAVISVSGEGIATANGLSSTEQSLAKSRRALLWIIP